MTNDLLDETFDETIKPKPIALIATLGLSPVIVQFELETGYLNIPFNWLTLITTDTARDNSKAIRWLTEHPTEYKIISSFEDKPEKAAALTREIINQIQELREKGYFVVADPTGGRKWMSAACSAAAAILNVPTIYVDARFKDGKPDPTTMEQYDMSSVLDEIAHLDLKEIEHFWASRNFPSVISTCNRIAENAPRAFTRELGKVLASVASIVHDIDRFEIYRSSTTAESLFARAEDACKRLKKLKEEWKNPNFMNWLTDFQNYITLYSSHLEESIYSINWVYGLVANAQTCIELGKYDDAVSRIKSAIEWSVKVALWQDYHVQLDNNYQPNGLDKYDDQMAGIGPEILNHIDRPKANKPSAIFYIGFAKMIRLARLLNELEDEKPITYDFRKVLDDFRSVKREIPKWNNKFVSLQDAIDRRNKSVLAHGRESVSEDFAKRFYKLCFEYLSTVTNEDAQAEIDAYILPPPPLT